MADGAVGGLPAERTGQSMTPVVTTRLVWLGWLAAVAVTVAHLTTGAVWSLADWVVIDGLTVLLWVVVTGFSGIVHSYSRRYLAGSRYESRFFRLLFGFTLLVALLVAADHALLFLASWLAMGLVMAALIGTVRSWQQARAAAAFVRRRFVVSSVLLGGTLVALWWDTGAVRLSEITASSPDSAVWPVAAGLLLLAAMIQSALVPFHRWLLSSMTAPTPASALMHAGFVNAGGILLTRFAPVVTSQPAVMTATVVVGAASAVLGKLFKSVQPDVKTRLGCSTTGQMGFMIMQAGLGFFGAAVTHLILHGCYKAYAFLSSGAVDRHGPGTKTPDPLGPVGLVAAVATAVAGGAVFAALTGKGTKLNSGVLLTGLVVVTTFQAARSLFGRTTLRPAVRYGAVAAVFLPAIVGYAAVYTAVTGLLGPAVTVPVELNAVHLAVGVAFGVVYVATETGWLRGQRLYVWLRAATRLPAATVVTDRGEYDER